MQNNLMFIAGQQIRSYDVYRKQARKDSKGKLTYVYGDDPICRIKASISVANQKEVEKYKAMGHPITHTLVQQLRTKVKAEDKLVREGMNYYVKGVDDPANLGFYSIIQCECKAGE